MYFIFVKVSNIDPNVDLFIHSPTFSLNEVKLILEGGFLTPFTSKNSSQLSTTLCPNGCGHLWTSWVLTIVFYNKYNFMDDYYSIENVAL